MIEHSVIEKISEIVGSQNCSNEDVVLRFYSGDLWPRLGVYRLLGQDPLNLPDAVVWPSNEEEIAEVLKVCAHAGVPVIPFGGGSGVCGGTVPVEGGVILDLKRLNRVLEVDEMSMTVHVQAGMLGQHLELFLNERGYTLGHFPSSIMCSTVGGWVSTRSAGQYSTKFGKIEDMVVGIDCVLPDGTRVYLDATEPHLGHPCYLRAMMGAEGTLGVITAVRLKINPVPSVRRLAAFRFMELGYGLEAMRSIMQYGLKPAVMRLYDPIDTLINGLAHERGSSEKWLRKIGLGTDSGRTEDLYRAFLRFPWLFQKLLGLLPLSSLLVIGFEGDANRTKWELETAMELIKRAQGRYIGTAPAEKWLRNRYSISFKLPKVFMLGAFAETLEVSALWRDIERVYTKARDRALKHAAVMAHFSHAYREGCAVYFSIAGYHEDKKVLLERYDRAVSALLEACLEEGGSLSHHHGIGMLKQKFMPKEIVGGERVFWALKGALDRAQIMNPGKVYPTTVQVRAQGETERGLSGFEAIASWHHKIGAMNTIVPEVPEEIKEILSLARATSKTIVARKPKSKEEVREDCWYLDLSRLDQVLEMDPVSGIVTVQAGMTLHQLENYLYERGFTLGFVPRSRLFLTVGEVLANAAPREGSPLYGSILDNCIGLRVMLADGEEVVVRQAPRRATGPDIMHCFLGSGGKFGIITAACFRVYPLPQVREAVAFALDDPVVCVSSVRTLLARNVTPEWVLVVVRSPSKVDSHRKVRLVMQFGGTREEVTRHLSHVRALADSLAMDVENVRPEKRVTPTMTRFKALERFVPLKTVMDLARVLAETKDKSFPEAHITDITTFGATFRLLLREEGQEFPEEIAKILKCPTTYDALKAVTDRFKEMIDPDRVLA
jgi:alkyldihydroxyacetonephosphate synthase